MQRWTRLYPLLACMWSPLHLAAANTGEWVRISDLRMPLAISVAATGVLWVVAAAMTRDPDKRSFLVFLGVLAFIGSGSLMKVLAVIPAMVNPALPTLLLLTVLGIAAVVGTVGSRRSFAPASRFLGLSSAFLLAFTLAQLTLAHVASGTVDRMAIPFARDSAAASNVDRPDIYLIVLDKYQGVSTLRSYYAFDNTPFQRALHERGFVLPTRPRANYTHTRQAMSALLNWEYLDSLVILLGENATDWTPIYKRVEANRAIAFLKRLDYEIVFFPNNYEPFRENGFADIQLPNPEAIRPELESAWMQSTILVPLTLLVCRIAACTPAPWLPESPALTDWKFAQLAHLPPSTHPRFVLAHFLVPHEPYVYGADCQHVPPSKVWPDSSFTRRAYLDQIRCVNKKVLAVVDAILRNSSTPPVILLQSDHGNGDLPRDDLELQDATPTMVRGRVDVFAAYHVPDAPDTLFYGGMTPVNLLPRVFNHLFGTTFPRQADRSFWVIGKAPYRITAVPPQLLGEVE